MFYSVRKCYKVKQLYVWFKSKAKKLCVWLTCITVLINIM